VWFGGDEFVLLLRGYEIDLVEIFVRLCRFLECILMGYGLLLWTLVGVVICLLRGVLDDVVIWVDIEMYKDKWVCRGIG